MDNFIPIAEPLFDGNELKYLTDCINTGWISSVGSYVRRFEQEFARYSGCKYGVAVHTGTAALHLALAALDIGPGDEVIVPDLTFAATANAVIYTGARPVLVDVDKDIWNIDPELIEDAVTERTKAIIPVHLYGHPCDMDKIMEISRKYGLAVIEDAAEAHGAEYRGRKVGSIGTVGCFSFFANKIITTGEGGVCVSDDPAIIDRIEVLRDHGMRKTKKYWHDSVGFNYRMTNLQAAVGLAQFERISWFIDRKRHISSLYSKYLSGLNGLVLPVELDWAKSSCWMFTMLLKKDCCRIDRDGLIAALKNDGIESRPVFYPLHAMPPYQGDKAFPHTDAISASGLSLPSSATLREEQVQYICNAIRKHIGQ